MVASATRRIAEPASQRVAVATSGGRDSTALLHCTLCQARPLGIEVVALHVHHGLQAAADEWLAQVRHQSRRWGARFDHRRLRDAPAKGQSIEAWARAARYEALAEMAREAGCKLVLLAHHRRDQAETWLIQALRGGGPAGLSAMPREAHRAGLVWCRPWLDLPPQAIQAYVARHRLHHIEDPSNQDPRYARNRLRLQVWPVLSQAFPDAEQCLRAAAGHAQEDARLRAEVAALDVPSVSGSHGLRVPTWLQLPAARRCLALRCWLQGQIASPSDSLVQRLTRELPVARSGGRWPAGRGELRLHREHLAWFPEASATAPAQPPGQAVSRPLDLSRAGCYALPAWGGSLVVLGARSGGARALDLQQLVLRGRGGGEHFSLAPGATARSLKKQFQARGLPIWERGGPLLFQPDGRLLFVPGLGIEASFQVPDGQAQLRIEWVPDPLPVATEPASCGS